MVLHPALGLHLSAGSVFRGFLAVLGEIPAPSDECDETGGHAARCLVVIDTDIHVERLTPSLPSYGELMLSPEEEAAVSTAVGDAREQRQHSDGFWQQDAPTAGAR